MNAANETITIQLGHMSADKTRRKGGAWVRGKANGHRFEALIFPEHAENRDWELGDSKISKLWIQRLDDRKTVYNWDRGLDVAAEDATVQAIVDFLCAILVDIVYANK